MPWHDVGVPDLHGERLASDDDRERAVHALTGAVVQGQFDLDEYADRTGRALVARTTADLQALLDDVAGPPAPVVAATRAEPEQIHATLSSDSRTGHWVVPPHLSVKALLGECTVDLRNAVIRQAVTTIDVLARLGSVSVLVPDGLDVRVSGRTLLGERTCTLTASARPGAPVLVIRCRVLLGEVSIRPASPRGRAGALGTGTR